VVVGHGMLAKGFAEFGEDDGVLIYAAGVSNSLETDPSVFAREKTLLLAAREEHRNKLLVYFGTCSVEDPDRCTTPYVAHKLEMEAVLERADAPWMILRLPLAIGPGQSGRTLAPFLHERISRGEAFEVWERATRYPIDVVDVLRIARRLIDTRELWNRKINVALRAFPVTEFVRVMEDIVGRRARCTPVPRGQHYAIDCPEVAALAQELDLDFSDRYLDRVLRKYFAGQ
jgi:nucleoside-diphosphate-sugar epimerase